MQIKKYTPLFLHKTKKGAISISFEELIGALLFIVIGGLILFVIVKLSGIFISGKDYESTIKSFDLLGEKINDLIKDKNYANANLLYFLDKDYVLVGFNYKDSSIQMETCKKGTIFRESESLLESRRKIGSLCDKACLCIYKDTVANDFDKDPQMPLQCKSFDKNVVFLAPSEQENIFCSIASGWNPKAYQDYYQAGAAYNFLILYGFNTKEIYMDKYESSDGNFFIFLTSYANDPANPIFKRKAFMEENYGKKN